MRVALILLFASVLLGCEKQAAPTVTKPSLDSTNPKERADAAREAAEKYGSKKP